VWRRGPVCPGMRVCWCRRIFTYIHIGIPEESLGVADGVPGNTGDISVALYRINSLKKKKIKKKTTDTEHKPPL